jgi:23S rRNA pseudouridine1911/1915/1917 synthase
VNEVAPNPSKIVRRAPEEAAGTRLDRFLADASGLSRARVKAAFEAGDVWVDGRRAKKGDRVVPGSEIVLREPSGDTSPVPQPELPLEVLLEDPAFLILNKPAGQPSHPLEPGERGTLANALAARYPECARAGEEAREGGLAHRLDVETSGAMVAARTPQAFRALRSAFSSRTVLKIYLALVGGAAGEGGEIDLPIAHHPKNPRKMIACADPGEAQRLRARPALTRYRVLERLGDFALLEAQIPTGVMHQIRVHLAAVGAPVAGDATYGGPSLPGLGRQFLHAATLGFPHPVHGAEVRVSAPLPAELEQILSALRTAASAP